MPAKKAKPPAGGADPRVRTERVTWRCARGERPATAARAGPAAPAWFRDQCPAGTTPVATLSASIEDGGARGTGTGTGTGTGDTVAVAVPAPTPALRRRALAELTREQQFLMGDLRDYILRARRSGTLFTPPTPDAGYIEILTKTLLIMAVGAPVKKRRGASGNNAQKMSPTPPSRAT